MYVVISIGNTDDKLSQREWSDYVADMWTLLEKEGANVHFFGGRSNWEQWQNVAWIVEVHSMDIDGLMLKIESSRKKYRQDSAFVMVGEGLFV